MAANSADRRKKPNATAAKPKVTSVVITRDSRTGRLVLDGTDERKLVHKHPSLRIQPSAGKAVHFTPGELKNLVKKMKIQGAAK